MKTPDEIKKGLARCQRELSCRDCPYWDGDDCTEGMEEDALAYIRQLEGMLENVICNFMDYVNDGVPNPAPYCAAGSELCIDGRGRCKPGCVTCNGFVPKTEDDNEKR